MSTSIASDDRLSAGEVKFVRWMPGGSGACLAETPNGQQWVVKLLHNRQGGRLLANELMGAVLMRSLGLPSLPWRRVRISGFDQRGGFMSGGEALLEENRKQTHFASLYLGKPNYSTMPVVICPEHPYLLDALVGLFVFDLWAAHEDTREVMLALHRRAQRTQVFAIDNGHLFYGPTVRAYSAEKCSVRMTSAMRAAVIQPGALASVLSWVRKMQAVLPDMITLQLRASTEWGENELSTNVEHFRDRLRRLPLLAQAEWRRQREEVNDRGVTAAMVSYDKRLMSRL